MYCKQPKDFNSLEEFIEHLKTKSEVIGVFQYGGRDYHDMNYGGDYDLIIILDSKEALNIGGLHLHVKHIPVDCALLRLSDIIGDTKGEHFNVVLMVSELIYDPKGILEGIHEKIKATWELSTPALPGEIQWDRFLRQHNIDKFKHRLQENITYSNLFLNANMFWLLENYITAKKLPPCNYKNALSSMEKNDQELYKLYEEYHATLCIERKLEITELLTKAILEPFGGPWKLDEIIFHYNDVSTELTDRDKEYILELIF